jgi:hypothetical protein
MRKSTTASDKQGTGSSKTAAQRRDQKRAEHTPPPGDEASRAEPRGPAPNEETRTGHDPDGWYHYATKQGQKTRAPKKTN